MIDAFSNSAIKFERGDTSNRQRQGVFFAPSPPLPFGFWPLGKALDSLLTENSASSRPIKCLEPVSTVVYPQRCHKSSDGVIMSVLPRWIFNKQTVCSWISSRIFAFILAALSLLSALFTELSSFIRREKSSYDWNRCRALSPTNQLTHWVRLETLSSHRTSTRRGLGYP